MNMFRVPLIYRSLNISSYFSNNQLPKQVSFLTHSNIEFCSARYFAKGKDKRKEDKGKGVKKKVEINEDFLGEIINIERLKSDMEFNLNKLHENFIKFVTVRSAIGSIETVRVNFESKKYPLNELARVMRKNPKLVVINMDAFPQAIPAVLTALSESGMNLNPQQEGTTIYIPIPVVTREYRENLAKNAKAHFIKCRDGIHDVQNKCLKSLKLKEKDGLSEDNRKEVEDQVKFISDGYVFRAQKMLDGKQTELLGNTEEK